ncbi:MAG TPA: 5-histidylcysteine sulfoxide synthase [Bdellovibrionales bacterium]|nr:5-histidylcysteine sulfoxide synthase [Bdellovibrionales bacterium]
MDKNHWQPVPTSLDALTRDSARTEFLSVWAMTEKLFSALKNEEAFLIPPPHRLRFPLMFYFAHPASFYLNKLRLAGGNLPVVHSQFESLFAMGIDEHSWDDVERIEGHWPRLSEAITFRANVKKSILNWLSETDAFDKRIEPDSLAWAFLMGLEHERIHLETTSALLRELPIEYVERPKDFAPLAATLPTAHRESWIPIELGIARLGRPPTFKAYHWDNEHGTAIVNTAEFEIASTPITNELFLEFVTDNGYENSEYWSEDGWAWRNYGKRNHPTFWRKLENQFLLRTIFEEVPLPPHWPAIVNYHEAGAYAAWRSCRDGMAYRLPNEAQQSRFRVTMIGRPLQYEDWFSRQAFFQPTLVKANFGWRNSSESNVDHENPRTDLYGNVWEWCDETFAPLGGFHAHPLYPDYSTPSFEGKHKVLLGGSFASSGASLTPWVRNAFRPHFFQHAGFRLVRSVNAKYARPH